MTEIVTDFAARGVHLWADGDLLRYRGPITAEGLDTLRQHKAEILAALAPPDTSHLSDFDFLALELTGADFVQFVADRDAGEAAGLSRDDAEYQAVKEWIARYRAERGRK